MKNRPSVFLWLTPRAQPFIWLELPEDVLALENAQVEIPHQEAEWICLPHPMQVLYTEEE